MMREPDYEKKYRELLKEYEAFAYIVSHDLAAPLRQIDGFINILLDDIGNDLTEMQESYTGMIRHAVTEANNTLDGLYQYSSLSTQEKHFEKVEPGPVIRQVLQDLGDKIAASGAQVEVHDMPAITADRTLLERLFFYLIDNAIKSQPEGQNPAVEIGAEEKDGGLEIFIRDSGIGIKEERIGDAFLIFRTLHAKDQYPGKGLGLAFAKKIAEIHGWDIGIDSRIGEGTTVTIRV